VQEAVAGKVQEKMHKEVRKTFTKAQSLIFESLFIYSFSLIGTMADPVEEMAPIEIGKVKDFEHNE